MIVSTILLTDDNYYVDSNNELPSRNGVEFDKELLISTLKGKVVSYAGYKMLPPSIKDLITPSDLIEPEAAITVPEIDGLSDLLIVTRSREIIVSGKQFRFDRFERIVKQKDIEIWRRK